jgi:hypothetical protein
MGSAFFLALAIVTAILRASFLKPLQSLQDSQTWGLEDVNQVLCHLKERMDTEGALALVHDGRFSYESLT